MVKDDESHAAYNLLLTDKANRTDMIIVMTGTVYFPRHDDRALLQLDGIARQCRTTTYQYVAYGIVNSYDITLIDGLTA